MTANYSEKLKNERHRRGGPRQQELAGARGGKGDAGAGGRDPRPRDRERVERFGGRRVFFHREKSAPLSHALYPERPPTLELGGPNSAPGELRGTGIPGETQIAAGFPNGAEHEPTREQRQGDHGR